jgi:hypothetical protein
MGYEELALLCRWGGIGLKWPTLLHLCYIFAACLAHGPHSEVVASCHGLSACGVTVGMWQAARRLAESARMGERHWAGLLAALRRLDWLAESARIDARRSAVNAAADFLEFVEWLALRYRSALPFGLAPQGIFSCSTRRSTR